MKAIGKTTAKPKTMPERNEPLFELLCAISDEVNELDRGIHALIMLGTCEDVDNSDLSWFGYRLPEGPVRA